MNGVCECATNYIRDSNGFCEPHVNCPANSHFNSYSGCCSCDTGYLVQGAQCIPQITCLQNSYPKNGLCYCNDGYVLIRSLIQCRKCNSNEIYNGQECVCSIGFARDSTGQCVKKYLAPTCGLNE